jgi:uncharacterized protein YraI
MTNDPSERVRPTFLAGLIVVLLLGIAVLNLTYSSEPVSKPYTTTLQGVNVRRGPSVEWNPPIGTIPPNTQTELLARSPDGNWFKVKYDKGVGWIFAAYTKPSVSPIQIPIDAGPPIPTLTPTPITPTPTLTPIASMTPSPPTNLVLGNVNFHDPLPLVCGKTVTISVEVANLGNESTTSSGSISIRDIVASTGQEAGSTSGGFVPIQKGQTTTARGIFLLVMSPVGEDHKLIVTINSDRSILETNYDDNSREFTYKLQGDCG